MDPVPSTMTPPLASAHEPDLGVIGIGLLGSALACRAMDAGLVVFGFDVNADRREAFQRAGGRAMDSAEEVAASCRRLLLVLPDDRVSREVFQAVEADLREGTVILDATTGDPAVAEVLAEQSAKRRVGYLDATLSGSSEQARAGTALIMVGGSREAFDECRDLLGILAGSVLHVGPSGHGAKMKLVTNLVLGLNRAALAEGLVFARSLGLDAALVLRVLKSSAASSRIMDSKGQKMLNGDFTPQARLSQHLKDVRLILAAARQSGQTLLLSETHRRLLEQAEDLGLGSLDNSAILRAIEGQKSSTTSP